MYKFNDLKIRCDWISFTYDTTDVLGFIRRFGFTTDSFRKSSHGAQGYRGMYRHRSQEITVLYDGGTDMGCHMDVKGSAIAHFLECFKETFLTDTPFGETAYEVDDFSDLDDMLRAAFKQILAGGWFTRLDLAIDDIGEKYFSCARVHKILKSCDYVSRFQVWDAFMSHNKRAEVTGYTIYCGSKEESDMFLRIYDKHLEQVKKKTGEEVPPWVRWEFVLKDSRADSFARFIVNGVDFGASAMALLNSFMRFIVNDDSNKSRCSSLSRWKRFVRDVGTLRLYSGKKPKSVQRSYNWIFRQCMPTIAGLVMANGGDAGFITDNLLLHYERLSAADQDMFEEYLMTIGGEANESADCL